MSEDTNRLANLTRQNAALRDHLALLENGIEPTPRGMGLFDPDDRIAGSGHCFPLATFEDIAPQSGAETALRQSEARLQAILDGMPDCVKIFD